MRLLLSLIVPTALAVANFAAVDVAAFQSSYPQLVKVRGGYRPRESASFPAKSSPTADLPNSMEAIQSRLAEINLDLPPPGGPKANYQLVHRDGDILYLSGHLPTESDGTLIVGACAPAHVREGEASQKWLSTEQGYAAAQRCALNLLSTLQSYLSVNNVEVRESGSDVSRPADLSHVKIVKLFGIVRSHDDFAEQHLVMNGASDVLKQALGPDMGGCHARSAIGTNTLPLGICVEVEMIAKIVE